ncbi:MAG: DNA-directed RNA polymerase subunit K [Candidatus Aenigmatarchaeota archaeon]|nr:DNA-directed RNA polymerase subunit K [Candidatus Aenigmarchaeota archaeon]
MPEWPKDRLTRFEVARIIGARSLQIFLGAPILIKTDSSDPMEIAEQEFKQIKIPMTIKRPMPDNSTEIVDIKKAIKNWVEENTN